MSKRNRKSQQSDNRDLTSHDTVRQMVTTLEEQLDAKQFSCSQKNNTKTSKSKGVSFDDQYEEEHIPLNVSMKELNNVNADDLSILVNQLLSKNVSQFLFRK